MLGRGLLARVEAQHVSGVGVGATGGEAAHGALDEFSGGAKKSTLNKVPAWKAKHPFSDRISAFCGTS